MNDFEDIWKPALVKAGVWKPEPVIKGECPDCHCLKIGHHVGGCEGAGGNCGCRMFYGFRPIPAPALGDAEAVMKMLEWLITSAHRSVTIWRNDMKGTYLAALVENGEETSCDARLTVPLALAAAVLAAKE